jgi:hypothetical protein
MVAVQNLFHIRSQFEAANTDHSDPAAKKHAVLGGAHAEALLALQTRSRAAQPAPLSRAAQPAPLSRAAQPAPLQLASHCRRQQQRSWQLQTYRNQPGLVLYRYCTVLAVLVQDCTTSNQSYTTTLLVLGQSLTLQRCKHILKKRPFCPVIQKTKLENGHT